jgi:hypothetical protein
MPFHSASKNSFDRREQAIIVINARRENTGSTRAD